MKLSRKTCLVGTALIFGFFNLGAAQGASVRAAGGEPSEAPAVKRFEVDNENIFGATEGTDTNEQGEREITFGLDHRRGLRGLSDPTLPAPQRPVRGGRHSATSASASFQYGLTDELGMELSAFGAGYRIRNVPEMDNLNRNGFDGLELNFKYRLLERTRENRFGLALVMGPRWGRFSDIEGQRQTYFGNEFGLLFDVRLLDDTLWYAANLRFEQQGGREKASRDFERESTLTVSHALSMRVFGDSFLGAEMRYARQYDGLLAQRFLGDALHIGPTFYQKFGKKAFFAASWGIAVAGRSHDPANAPGQKLNLTQFSRHLIQAKTGFEF